MKTKKPPRKYGTSDKYEAKLKRVMARFGIERFEYHTSSSSCDVEFYYHGQHYKFENDFEKSKKCKQNLAYVSDLFAQIVLTLEVLARSTEWGLYSLGTLLDSLPGVRQLPEPASIPVCFAKMGFYKIPTEDELRALFREKSKESHPDSGGEENEFKELSNNFTECLEFLRKNRT